ncbi:MAG: transition metal ABC transporter permease subunit TroC [Treponema sp.]|nr:transition metal ABC transporter permease subunit TroC [Treponema sp.]
MHTFVNFFSDYTMRNVLLGTLFLGVGSGVLGCFIVLRRQSLLGDAISHAALPGIVIAFLLTGTKTIGILLTGGAISSLIGTLCITAIMRTTKIDKDGAHGNILGVFFGLGFLLLTHVQKSPDAAKAGLDKFIFGQGATIMHYDVMLIACVECVILACVFLFWKELKITMFDPTIATVMGFSSKKLELLLVALIVPSIVAGIQSVGVILMSALLVAPAAAARQWTHRLGIMCMLAAFFGGSAGVVGSVISACTTKLATGPVIVLVSTSYAFLSLLVSPKRGILPRMLRTAKYMHLQKAKEAAA